MLTNRSLIALPLKILNVKKFGREPIEATASASILRPQIPPHKLLPVPSSEISNFRSAISPFLHPQLPSITAHPIK